MIRSAATADPDIAGLWSRIESEFYENQRAIVTALHEKNALRSTLDVTAGTDVLWTLNHPDLWQLLVGTRGWDPEQYEKWFGDTACQQLLAEASRR